MIGWIGRADLVRLLVRAPGTKQHAAQLLQYDLPEEVVESDQSPAIGTAQTGADERSNNHTGEVRQPARDEEVWHVKSVEHRSLPEADLDQPSQPLPPEGGSLRHRPPTPPLSSWRALWPRLYRLIAESQPSRRVDAHRLVRHLSQARPLRFLPRKHYQRWPERLVIWLDCNDRLIPIWDDHDMVRTHLEQWCPTIEVRSGSARFDARPGDIVLLLGDLSLLSSDVWQRRAHRWRDQGVRLGALSTRPVKQRRWQQSGWPVGRATTGTPQTRAEALLVLASKAILVQPGLLRTLRLLLPPDEADLHTELDAWIHPDVRVATPAGLILDPKRARELRRRFARLDPALQADAIRTIRDWHDRMPATLRHIEALLSNTQGEAFSAATAWFDEVARELIAEGDAAHDDYARAASEHLVSVLDHNPELRRTISLLWLKGHPDSAVPDGVDVSLAHLIRGGEQRELVLRQQGNALSFTGPGMPLTQVQTSQMTAWVRRRGERQPWNTDVPFGDLPDELIEVETDLSRVTIERIRRPAWAEEVCVERGRASVVVLLDGRRHRLHRTGVGEWSAENGTLGADATGFYEDIDIFGVKVRFRYILAGSFLMGSPVDEAGRRTNEGPQHEVELNTAFWLAEHPTTQALWQAVTGKNPSRFRHPDRPVEQVSWDDAQAFIKRINQETPALHLRLPTEAEWEYACRAGTTTATWVGDLEILGDNNAPVLDEIAWYGGNSGVDFDLEKGSSSASWPEKQYDHQKAGTRVVGIKAPNPWGLFDMLGNVLEWCSDQWSDAYEPGKQVNPTGPTRGVSRVIRGGSWVGSARGVRAAYRYRRAPVFRFDFLGFRLARGPAQGARSAGPAERAGAEPPGTSK
jgi:formylglycine-generating enzyme required for sulfatase activity